ncbi:MAG: thiamine pyrophosphate-dependent enzyme [bacterium]|nr:thiamine pyrophosphate-dependent enzyme [bacterium]
MRSKDYGLLPGLTAKCSREDTLAMFSKVCFSRFFEFKVKEAAEKKLIKCPIYLSLGQESISSALAVAFPNPAIFGQHRCHDLYLAYGGDPTALRDELLHRPTGCTSGMGGSASIHSPAIKMFGHDGFMGTQVPIAIGYAFGAGQRTLAVMGDASAEEDYVLAALGLASTKKAPVLFVCADNNLSILTEKKVRRNWHMAEVASAFKLRAVEITDDPWLIMHQTRILSQELPAFMNIHTARAVWHAGTGCDGPPEWDRFSLIKEEVARLGLQREAEDIEIETQDKISLLWAQKLPGEQP